MRADRQQVEELGPAEKGSSAPGAARKGCSGRQRNPKGTGGRGVEKDQALPGDLESPRGTKLLTTGPGCQQGKAGGEMGTQKSNRGS